MAAKPLSIPLCDIKQNSSEGVLSFCKSPSLFSKLFGEPRVLLKKCQIQVDYELGSETGEHTLSDEMQGDHVHGRKRTLRNLKSVDYELHSESSEHTSSDEIQEDHIHGRKRTLTNLKSEDSELDSESSGHTSSDYEEGLRHYRKKEFRNGIYLKNKKQASKRSKASERKKNKKHASKRSKVSVHEEEDEGRSHCKKKSHENSELDSQSRGYTSSDEEEEGRSHDKKKSHSAPVSDYQEMIAERNTEQLALLRSVGIIQEEEEDEGHSHDKEKSHENSDLDSQSRGYTSSDEEEEEEGRSHGKKKSHSAPVSDYQKVIAERNKEQLALLRSVGIIQEKQKEQEDERKRSLRNLKSVKYAENASDHSTSDEDYEVDSENSEHTSSDDEEEVHSHSRKKEFGNMKSHKNKKQASKRSKASERKKNKKQASKRSKASEHKVKFAESESDYSTSDENTSADSTSDEEEGRSCYKKKSDSAPLSDYEKMIAEKNKERLALLSSLGVMEAKDDFCGILSSLKPKPVKRVVKVKGPTVQERCSQRVAKQTHSIDYNEDAMHEQNIEKQEENNSKPLEMSFKTALKYPKMYEDYIEDFNLQNPIVESADVHYDENVLEKLILDECSFIRIVPNFSTVLAWYPSSEDLILAVGDTCGWLGIYKLGPESSPYLFKPHYTKITNVLFNPLNRVHMVSSSNDGSVFCADLVKHTFTKIYDRARSVSHSYFDFLSLTTCLVSQTSYVALVDYRTNRITGEMSHKCHTGAVSTVHVHPVHKHKFLTAGHDSLIRLWDLRMLRNNAPTTYHVYDSPVQCAYFSPGTGNFILSSSAYDISIIKTQGMTQGTEMKREYGMKDLSLSGNPKNNRRQPPYLRNVKWLPDSQSMFVVNHVYAQDGIKVCVKGAEVCHKIQQEDLRVKGLSAFHPCKPVLAGVAVKENFFFFSYKS